jgi:hypothetical protein
LRDHLVAQFGGAALRPAPLSQGESGFAGDWTSASRFRFLVQTLGELLKFVVNSRLPIERLKQNITSLSRGRRHKTCCGGLVECGLELKGGKLPGFGIIPT